MRFIPQLNGSRQSAKRAQGFALVIALLLMAFVLTLMLALSYLVRAEVSSLVQQKKQQEAKQNALFGLWEALGQLQQNAGPDQRATGTADILGDADGNSVTVDGSRYWTGVWGNTSEPDDIFTSNPTPVLLNWLVSGNVAPPDVSVTASGRIASAPDSSDIRFWPGATVNGISGATARDSNLKLSTGEEVRLLVGPGTVANSEGYVVAPLSTIGAANGQASGRYAWWVGDEGVKAKYTVVDPYTVSLGAGGMAGRYRVLAAQRLGVEHMSRMSSYPINKTSLLDKVFGFSQIKLADATLGDSDLKQHYHNLTVSSWGLLTNARKGGFRHDLTADFAQAGLSGNIIPDSVFPAGVVPRGPRWEILRSWASLADEHAPLSVRAATESVHGITPVIVQLRYYISLHIEPDGHCYVRSWPAFVLGNPYSKSIAGAVDLKIISSGYPRVSFRENGADKFVVSLATTGGGGFLGGIDFRIDDMVLAPGEVKVYFPDIEAGVVQNSGIIKLGDVFYPDAWIAYDTGVSVAVPTASTQWEWMNQSGGEIAVELRESSSADVLQVVSRIGEPGTTTPIVLTPPTSLSTGYDYLARGYTYTLKGTRPQAYPVRPYADYNIRAQSLHRSAASGAGFSNNALYVSGSVESFNAFTLNAEHPRWGRSITLADGKTGMVLFAVPSRETAAGSALLSLGQLQHASMTADNVYFSTAHQPGYAIGNSLASPFISRELSFEGRTFGGTTEFHYDMSYLLNAALWDDYFFSTVPQGSGVSFTPGVTPLPNQRLVVDGDQSPTLADMQDADRVAAVLKIDGAFNVNSISEEAWAAVLSSLSGLAMNGEADLDVPFPRSIDQPGGSASAADGISDNAFSGFRNLSSDQIRDPDTGDGLARVIVREIRKRGPFLSLAQFVNRPLTDSRNAQGLSGVMQASIDTIGLNAGFPDSETITSSNLTGSAAYVDTEAALGARGTNIPGWLSQADILQPLAPILSTRSDTFVIRAYGESVNSFADGGSGDRAQAWCEAIVQRCPEYVDADNDQWELPAELNNENLNFGRRFRIVSFRWLDADSI